LFIIYFGYLTTLSVLRPHSVDDRMINEYGAVGEYKLTGKPELLGQKSTPVPLWPSQAVLNLTWDGTLAAEVGSRRLTARANAVYSVDSYQRFGRIYYLLSQDRRVTRASEFRLDIEKCMTGTGGLSEPMGVKRTEYSVPP
jgi:hypothetical protein